MRRFPALLHVLPLALLLAACGEKAAPPKPPIPEVGVVTLEPRTLPLVYEQVGQTAGYREVEVRARVAGILLKRLYTEGQRVREGEVLFKIDPDTYKAALDQAKGVLRQNESALERATLDRDRIAPLFKENAVSRKDFDDANSNYESAKASVESARANVKQAEINLAYTDVVAPIAGYASKENKSEGSLVSPTPEGGLLTTISQLDPLYVNFSVSESEMLAYNEGVRTGRITSPKNNRLEARARLADGTIAEARGVIDFTDAKLDTKTGTMRARAEFPNPNYRILSGQFVRVLVSVGDLKDVLAVPERAITQAQATRLVLVVNAQNKVEARPVKLGSTVNGEVVLAGGVKAGERVVVDGLMKARPGSEVKPVAPKPAPQPGEAPPAPPPAAR